ncbi:MAG: hypothetical protein JNJ54_25380 [Myxococcaceae bacterium]|nr:hypothetical protein [Myxococcaceae bacterium]
MTIDRSTNIPRTNLAEFNQDSPPVNNTTIKKPLKDDQNTVVNKRLIEQAAQHVHVIGDFVIPKTCGAEQGHAPQPSAGERAAQEAKAKRDEAIATNERIRQENAPLLKEIEALEKQAWALDKLLDHVDSKGDSVLTWHEVNNLAATSGLPEVKEAANWLLNNPHAYEALKQAGKRWTLVGGDNSETRVSNTNVLGGWGAGRVETAGHRAALRKLIEEKKACIKPFVDVPPVPSSSSSASTGTSGAGGPAGTPEGPKSPSTPPKETSAQAEARVLSNYKGVGPFSSDATTAEGRMQDAMSHVQKGIDALQLDLVAASTKDPVNQAEVMMIQNKMQQIQNALSALMQMMKQQQETMSNISKMYSDMAMSAIRNMR